MLFFQDKNKKIKWLFIVLAIFLILGMIAAATCYLFESKYKNKIYPGISVGEIDLSGLTKEQAVFLLNKKIDYINNNGVDFSHEDKHAIIFPLITSLESDLAYEIINFKIEETVSQLLKTGRTNDLYKNIFQKLSLLTKEKSFNILFQINEDEIKKILGEHFSKYETPPENAKLVYSKKNEIYNFSVEKEKFGDTINYEKGLKQLKNNLSELKNSSINLESNNNQPKIYEKDCLNIGTKAQAILNKVPLTLNYKEKEWIINKDVLVGWLVLKLNNNPEEKDKTIISIDYEKVGIYFEENISPDINIEPVEAKFEIKDGRVTEFKASKDGLELDIPQNILKIENNILEKEEKEESEKIELIVKVTKSKTETEEINNLGIKEIIGTGESNFAGSPSNRRHNIKIGADSLAGILIKPGEEFSLLAALGEINAESGYLPELVIKDNKTIAEYGGGLCQIGTTVFRTALATGLDITMRRNHSYRVGYYEPAGTDATIYDPWPDFKFINNNPGNILIQSRIEGDNIYFDFWGTSDGRIVEQTKPEIYNIVSPGPAKIIETLDLEPGVKKCTESAHNGADAYFDYKITYADGEIFEKRYTSHYVPWRAVCLVGVEELTEESEDNKTATSTEEKIE